MQNLKIEIKRIERWLIFWNSLDKAFKFVLPSIAGIAIGTGLPELYQDKESANKVYLVICLVGIFLFYLYVIGGVPIFGFIDRNKDWLTKEKDEYNKQIESAKEVHLLLDSYRDRMLFDGCNKYWTVIEKLESVN